MGKARQAMCLLACVGGVMAGQTSPSATLDRVTSVVRAYARGVTENRFDAACQIRSFDAAGKLRKTKQTRHRMEFARGRYRGSDPALASDWTGTLRIHGGRRNAALQLYTDTGAFMPIFVFAPAARHNWDFEIGDAPASGLTTVRYRSKQPCSTFEPASKGFRMAAKACGDGEVDLDLDGAAPVRMTQQAAGLPVSSGDEIMSGYEVETLFHKVAIPGAELPISVPGRATATYTIDDKKTVLECSYKLNQGRR